jgi:hypothetical protein
VVLSQIQVEPFFLSFLNNSLIWNDPPYKSLNTKDLLSSQTEDLVDAAT